MLVTCVQSFSFRHFGECPRRKQCDLKKIRAVRECNRWKTEYFANLGRIRDVNLDLASGRIIEVFVVTGDVLGFGGKTVASRLPSSSASPPGASSVSMRATKPSSRPPP